MVALSLPLTDSLIILVPLPDVNPEVFIAYANDFERRSVSAQESVQNSNARQTRITSVTPEQMENEQLNAQMNRHKAEMKQEQEKIAKERDQLDAREKELRTMQICIIEQDLAWE
mmetsp:Transcript_1721/g.2913  ORF Transcript_1721/g.2913 Transcript_1721/m.2913 type:complete len:115 (+) Transcript_1721:600-944(+)